METAFFHDLRNAAIAELVGARNDEERIIIQFDLTALFDTPVQFAIDECNQEAIEERAGEYHSAYAYWIPDWERHSITLTERDLATERMLVVTCGPKQWIDDGARAWIRETNGEVYAAAALAGFTESIDDHADPPAIESATVSWRDDDGGGRYGRLGDRAQLALSAIGE